MPPQTVAYIYFVGVWLHKKGIPRLQINAGREYAAIAMARVFKNMIKDVLIYADNLSGNVLTHLLVQDIFNWSIKKLKFGIIRL